MQRTELLDQIAIAIKSGDHTHTSGWAIIDALYDGDNKSGELVLVAEDGEGGHKEFIISSERVREIEGDQMEPEGECANCENGTLGLENGRLVCRGECGEDFGEWP